MSQVAAEADTTTLTNSSKPMRRSMLAPSPGFVPVDTVGLLQLPVEFRPGPVVIADFVQSQRVVQTTIHHRVAHAVGIVNVYERVLVEHDDIGQLPYLER